MTECNKGMTKFYVAQVIQTHMLSHTRDVDADICYRRIRQKSRRPLTVALLTMVALHCMAALSIISG